MIGLFMIYLLVNREQEYKVNHSFFSDSLCIAGFLFLEKKRPFFIVQLQILSSGRMDIL